MKEWLNHLWPRPNKILAAKRESARQEGRALDARIRSLQGLSDIESAAHLEAVRRMSDEEEKRKSGAESRATTFIAAVAALIPLMTWAIGNTTSPTCSPGWGCSIWTLVFALAVVYFVTAAYWALKALAVANYHVIGVEDIVQVREQRKDIYKELIQQTLLEVRRNRDTINQKITCIMVAQRRFFNGLAILALLLMFDPISKLGILEAMRSKFASHGSTASSDAPSSETKFSMPLRQLQNSAPPSPPGTAASEKSAH